MRIVSSNQGSPKKRKMSPTCAGVSRMALSEYPVRASSFCSAVFLAIQLRRVRRAEAGCMWGRERVASWLLLYACMRGRVAFSSEVGFMIFAFIVF